MTFLIRAQFEGGQLLITIGVDFATSTSPISVDSLAQLLAHFAGVPDCALLDDDDAVPA
ncbi:hypothetical protein [Burkholderia gladioli]|uniref:hypothetical protein n=1 Tax=Burkholderia gladioli TaxID=28095 RepID=UPI00163ECD22|nr:hypothetical protein [Burkholderia gladioli]